MAKKNEIAEEVAIFETAEKIPDALVDEIKERMGVAVPAVQSQEPFDDGLGELSAEDLIIPRIVVGQAQSQIPDEAKGKLYCEVTGDIREEIEMVIIKMSKSRVMFPEKFSRDSKPLCKSSNFIVPDEMEDQEPMSATCADCQYSKWGAGRTPPACNETWSLLVIDLESYTPAWFSLKSTMLKSARKILSALKMRATAKRIPVWGFSFMVGIEVRSGAGGDSYVPTFSNIKQLDTDDAANMATVRSQLAGEKINPDDYSKQDDYDGGGAVDGDVGGGVDRDDF